MRIEELNKNMIEFINKEIEYIQTYLITGSYVADDFFLSANTYYGKDYSEGTSFRDMWGKKGIYIIFMDNDIYLDYNAVFKFNECASGGE